MESVDTKQAASNGKRILVVDDDPNIVRLIKVNLERNGYEVETAGDGVQALAHIRENRPDLLITGIEMPSMGGLQLIEAIRSDTTLKELPVIVMKSDASAVILQRSFLYTYSSYGGANRIIIKPFDSNELLAIINDMLFRGFLEGKSVLLIRGCFLQRARLREAILECGGYKVKSVSKEKALTNIKLNRPELVITDIEEFGTSIENPEMDGLEIIRLIRSDPGFADIPILLIYPHCESAKVPDINHLLSCGADRVLSNGSKSYGLDFYGLMLLVAEMFLDPLRKIEK